jgi:TolB-like protein/Flp pilus assembly protein TadD
MSELSKAVFLSYASQDAEAAKRVCEALRAAGVEVWFDQSELRGGDAWDQRIKQQIRECRLFVPVISKQTDLRPEGYFRREWKLAVDRTHDMADDQAFLLPVVIDETPDATARVPERFRQVQWLRLPKGEAPPAFVERVSRLLSAETYVAPGPSRPITAHARRWPVVSRPLWVALAVAIVAAYLAFDKLGPRHRADGERAATPAGQSVAPVPSAIADKSIAVLPFENRSRDQAQDFYADGLTDELTTALARISALKVIATSSSARYRGSNKRPAEIAHDLGVAALVTGSVLRADGRVRYTAALVSASTEHNLWAESYQRDERDVLALQSEVARSIAQAIAVRMSPAESERLADTHAVDPRAFDEYLLGRSLWNQRTERNVRAALVHFENATHIAPDFALGYAGVADSHIILGVHGFDPPLSALPVAKAAALKAIELDPTAGEPHASLGDILFHYEWDWVASEREHEKAIELAPAFATAYQWGAEAQVLLGDLAGALARLQRARSLDPHSMMIRTSLANTYGLLGRRTEAVAELRAAIASDPSFPRARRELALQLLALGRTDEALAEARKLAELAPDNPADVATLGLCLGRAGHADEARALLTRLDATREKPFVSSLERARVAAGLLNRGLTLRYLERAVDAREGNLPFIGGDDEFAFLHHDSRYLAITRKVGIGASHGAPPPRATDGK